MGRDLELPFSNPADSFRRNNLAARQERDGGVSPARKFRSGALRALRGNHIPRNAMCDLTHGPRRNLVTTLIREPLPRERKPARNMMVGRRTHFDLGTLNQGCRHSDR
jgi:hypothetical protein